MKYYKVNLHDIRCDDYYDGQAIWTDQVIVSKGLTKATDILTGQEFPIIPTKEITKPYYKVSEKYQDRPYYERVGYQLAVISECFTKENIATFQDVADYVDNFDSSRYAEIYREIKVKLQPAKEKQLTVRQLVKQVQNSKK